MRTEYHTLVENNTWELTDRPANKKILTNKWVFKLKKNQDGSMDKYKARLVARGHEQRAGIDYEEVFAPVARYETIRTLLAVAVQKKLRALNGRRCCLRARGSTGRSLHGATRDVRNGKSGTKCVG